MVQHFGGRGKNFARAGCHHPLPLSGSASDVGGCMSGKLNYIKDTKLNVVQLIQSLLNRVCHRGVVAKLESHINSVYHPVQLCMRGVLVLFFI